MWNNAKRYEGFESLEIGKKKERKKTRRTKSVRIILGSSYHDLSIELSSGARVRLAFFLFFFFSPLYLFLIAFGVPVDTTINVRVTCVKPTLRKADVSGQRLPFSSYSNEMREGEESEGNETRRLEQLIS